MGPLSFPANSPAPESSATAVPNDQRMAMLAELFRLELETEDAEDEGITPWPMGKTILFAVGVSAALWAAIIAVARLVL